MAVTWNTASSYLSINILDILSLGCAWQLNNNWSTGWHRRMVKTSRRLCYDRSGSLWAELITAQAGWRNMPNLSQRKVFTILLCHPVEREREKRAKSRSGANFGLAWASLKLHRESRERALSKIEWRIEELQFWRTKALLSSNRVRWEATSILVSHGEAYSSATGV